MTFNTRSLKTSLTGFSELELQSGDLVVDFGFMSGGGLSPEDVGSPLVGSSNKEDDGVIGVYFDIIVIGAIIMLVKLGESFLGEGSLAATGMDSGKRVSKKMTIASAVRVALSLLRSS